MRVSPGRLDLSADAEWARWRAGRVNLPHREIRSLDVTGEFCGVPISPDLLDSNVVLSCTWWPHRAASVEGQVASVHRDQGSGDPARSVGREKHGKTANIVRLPQPQDKLQLAGETTWMRASSVEGLFTVAPTSVSSAVVSQSQTMPESAELATKSAPPESVPAIGSAHRSFLSRPHRLFTALAACGVTAMLGLAAWSLAAFGLFNSGTANSQPQETVDGVPQDEVAVQPPGVTG